MKKEEIYVNLKGKTKQELTDLWEFLTSNGEIISDNKEYFVETHLKYNSSFIALGSDNAWKWWGAYNKTEVTIEQLKEIIKLMKTKFTPIAMKCNQEQFEAIKPKLLLPIFNISDFNLDKYLTNFYDESKIISNVINISGKHSIYETWNEEIFLKACGIEVESLQQQLQKAEAEVKRLKEEINKPKAGDWIYDTTRGSFYKKITQGVYSEQRKITNPELIKLLENECITKN